MLISSEASQEERPETIPEGSTHQVVWKWWVPKRKVVGNDIVRSTGKPVAACDDAGRE